MRLTSPFSTSPAATADALRADSIINPEAPLALRLSGQLLLGVVKVYSKKVGYLYQDCNDALQKIKEVRCPSCPRHVRALTRFSTGAACARGILQAATGLRSFLQVLFTKSPRSDERRRNSPVTARQAPAN